MITIDGKGLPTRRPANLDEQLIAATGCTAAEHIDMLGLKSTPYQVARALAPFLDDKAPDVPTLAEMIGRDDLVRVRAEVVALLRAAVEKEEG